jgi:membrane protein YdbS with pleckstrin-like domain
MNVFEADSRLAFTSAVVAAVVCVFAALVLAAAAVLVPLSMTTFLFATAALALLVLTVYLVVQAWQMREVTYTLDRNAFIIRWGDTREVVPMGDVQRVIAATDIEQGLRFVRFPLPGWWFGTARHPALGRLRMYSTAPLDQQVIIVTPEQSYAVSPYDDEAFLDAFRTRLEMRPTQNVQHARLLPAYMQWPIWSDTPALALLILAIALNLVTFGLSAGRFPSAPAQLALHFDGAGVADRLGEKAQLFVPPAIALITLLLNLGIGLALYRKGERLAAQLLWGGSIAVQLLFFVATATIGFTLPS